MPSTAKIPAIFDYLWPWKTIPGTPLVQAHLASTTGTLANLLKKYAGDGLSVLQQRT
jgi:hypothetical protein